ncbi:MAG: hypothetical protein AAGP08_08465 [Pseudomonadota bacterium]
MNAPKLTAQQIWDDVLAGMPADLHKKYALVTARRQLIGLDNAAKLAEEIDALAVAAFGPNQVAPPPVPESPAPPPQPAAPSLDEIEEHLRLIVYESFEGTFDGSTEQAEYRRQRALEAVEQSLASHKHLGWIKKRLLRAMARDLADAQVTLLTSRPWVRPWARH